MIICSDLLGAFFFFILAFMHQPAALIGVAFFASLAEFHDGKVVATAVNGDVSFSEWFYDMSFKNGQRVKLAQVAVRKWKNGKVAHERFYYNKG